MPYTRPYTGGFKDYPDTTTPINATALNTMDVGIKTANDQFQTVTTAQRTALTPTVGQAVWDSDLKQLMVYMNASGGNAWQPVGNRIVCASTTRPSTPFHGQMIYETDTKKEFVYNGSAWVQTNTASTTSGVTGVSSLIVPPMCKLVAATSQSVVSGADTTLTLGTSEIDTDSMGTTGASAKITINTAGVYMVTYSITMASSAGGTFRAATVAKNGTGSPNAGSGLFWASAPFTAGYSASWRGGGLLNLAVNDYLQLVVIQDSGGALNVGNLSNHTFLSAVWIGRTS